MGEVLIQERLTVLKTAEWTSERSTGQGVVPGGHVRHGPEQFHWAGGGSRQLAVS